MSEALAKELMDVRRRGLSRLDLPKTRLKRLHLPLLTAIARHYRSKLSPRDAITALVRDAAERMDEGLARDTVIRLFGLDRDLSAPDPGLWRDQAQALHPPMEEKTFQAGPQWHCLVLLAEAIHALAGATIPKPARKHSPRALLPAQEAGPLVPGFVSSYVWREDCATQFATLLRQGHDRVAIVGQPGMGTRRLADDVVSARAAQADVAWIRVHDNEPDVRDLEAACHEASIGTPADVDGRYLLRKLVTAPASPRFVVLDGLHTADTLTDLLPASMTTVVVASAWTKTATIPKCGIVRVGPFTAAQTDTLLRLRCPRLTAADRSSLVYALAGHPAVTGHIAGLLGSASVTPKVAVTALTEGAPAFVSNIKIGPHRSLGDELTLLTRTLETHNRLAGEILRGLAFLPARRIIPTETLHLYATTAGLLTGTPAETAVMCAQATMVLRTFGYLSHETSIGITVHPLVQAVLRLIYHDHIDTIEQRLRGIHHAITNDTRNRPHRDTIKALTVEALHNLPSHATTA